MTPRAAPDPSLATAEWLPPSSLDQEENALKSRLDRLNLLVFRLGLPTYAAFSIALFVAAGKAWDAFATLGVLLVTGLPGLLFFITARRRRERLTDELEKFDDALLDEFGRTRGWLVDLTVLQGSAPIGADRGILWIEDGRLLFSGRRTSFALTTDEITQIDFAEAWSPQPHVATIRLPVFSEVGPYAVSLRLVRFTKWSGANFRQEIRGWSALPAIGSGQYPPLVPGPGLKSEAKLLSEAAVVTLYWTAIVFVSFWSFGGPFCAALALWIGYHNRLLDPAARWKAWSDLRRIRRSLERRAL